MPPATDAKPFAMTRYVVTRRIACSRQQIFDLVADVERYPEFVPAIAGARVDRRTPREAHVEMLFAFGVIRRRIRSVGRMKRPSRIDISSNDAPFRFCEFHWQFAAIGKRASQVTFRAEFAFRNRLWQRLFAAHVAQGLEAMVEAFLRRADQLYGLRTTIISPRAHSFRRSAASR